MSRIGNAPITLPSGVDVAVAGQSVTVKGPKGEMSRRFPERISISVEDGVAKVARADESHQVKALHGLSRALLNNMVLGVSDGFRRELEIQGVGYRAQMRGSAVELQVGFSHPVTVEAPAGVTFEVPEPTRINVIGIDKELVGQTAADIRKVRPPEPYKGKGIRYVGEHVRRKAGKAGK
ncbi:MAG TPA: 50S ribosomal protein L6 [Acidimicrobiia bacterium]|nr:50S ribosomal protein L6 [Acidimicrobiia bacterium]